MVKRLKKNHKVICTGRKYRELSNLAKIRRFNLIFVGKHGGGEKSSKLKASISRMNNLQKFVEKQKPDLTISFCSPEASRVSFGLGIKHIGFSDSPHAKSVMKLFAPLVQKLLIPSILPKSEFTKFGINSKDIIKYNAIDAASIAKRTITKKKLPFDKKLKTVLFRIEEEQAAYLNHQSKAVSIIKKIYENTDDVNIVVLARYNEQIKKLKKAFGNKIIILTKSYDGKFLLLNVDLFIGSGGTMTAESALLGIPTISYNAVPNLVEKFLIKKKIAVRESNPTQIAKITQKILGSDKKQFLERGRKIMNQMQDPYTILNNTIKIIQ